MDDFWANELSQHLARVHAELHAPLWSWQEWVLIRLFPSKSNRILVGIFFVEYLNLHPNFACSLFALLIKYINPKRKFILECNIQLLPRLEFLKVPVMVLFTNRLAFLRYETVINCLAQVYFPLAYEIIGKYQIPIVTLDC